MHKVKQIMAYIDEDNWKEIKSLYDSVGVSNMSDMLNYVINSWLKEREKIND